MGHATGDSLRLGRRRLKSKNKRHKRSRLLLEFGPFCHLCGRLILRSELTVDHIRPIGRGGTNAIDNLALAHDGCNQAKGHRTGETTQASASSTIRYDRSRFSLDDHAAYVVAAFIAGGT